MPKPLILPSKPGIKRDGTVIEGEYYTDGEWVRFNNFGRPRKMGGLRQIQKTTTGQVYGMETYTDQGQAFIYTGHAAGVECQLTDMNGNIAGGTVDRTPAGFVPNANNVWQFDVIYDPSAGNNLLLAHVAQNLANIDNNVGGALYYGTLTSSAALVAASGAPSVSGGVVVAHPYTMLLGSDGRISWPVAGTLTYTGGDSGSARVAGTKLIRGIPIRGGVGGAPAVFLAALDSIVKGSYIGGTAIFTFDTIATKTTPMSSRSILDYDGIIYWPSQDRFMIYTGVVREVKNNQSTNFFFDNISPGNRQKVFAFKVPRWGEIWFCFPKGSATYCNHAVIYNVRLGEWYDTPLPFDGRTDASSPNVFPFPVVVGAVPESNGLYNLWQHEYKANGVDQYDMIYNGLTNAIRSFFTTGDISMSIAGMDLNACLSKVYPDLNQTGSMNVQVLSRPFPRAADIRVAQQDFGPDTLELNNLHAEGMFNRLRFESNVAGGYYEMGDTMLMLDPGSGRPTGA